MISQSGNSSSLCAPAVLLVAPEGEPSSLRALAELWEPRSGKRQENLAIRLPPCALLVSPREHGSTSRATSGQRFVAEAQQCPSLIYDPPRPGNHRCDHFVFTIRTRIGKAPMPRETNPQRGLRLSPARNRSQKALGFLPSFRAES